MSHMSVYRVKSVRVSAEVFSKTVEALTSYLKELGFEISVVRENAVVRDYYGNTQAVDVAIVGDGDPLLERGLGLNLRNGKIEIVGDFYMSKLASVDEVVKELASALTYAEEIQSTNPEFIIESVEVNGTEVRLGVGVGAGTTSDGEEIEVGGDYWL